MMPNSEARKREMAHPPLGSTQRGSAEFDAALVEQAARALCGDGDLCDGCVETVRVVLTAAAPTLRAEGARQVCAECECETFTCAGCGARIGGGA